MKSSTGIFLVVPFHFSTSVAMIITWNRTWRWNIAGPVPLRLYSTRNDIGDITLCDSSAIWKLMFYTELAFLFFSILFVFSSWFLFSIHLIFLPIKMRGLGELLLLLMVFLLQAPWTFHLFLWSLNFQTMIAL